jgi:hypothetical protein
MAMKLFTGWALAAAFTVGSLALGATAEAQVLGPSRVSDFSGPYVDGPYRGGSYYGPPPVEVAPPPPRYGYGGYGPTYAPGYAPAALVPPHEVYNIIREAGFSPLGIPQQRGFIYTIAVIDRGGEDGRLVIDARSGRILRFVPAWQNGASYERARNAAYGPPGPLPPTAHLGNGPRPPASVPKVASRSVPVPKPSPLASKPAREAARPAETAVAKPVPAPPTQQAAVAPAKPADTAPATTATIGQAQTEAKPALSILPTQDMPKVQGLE